MANIDRDMADTLIAVTVADMAELMSAASGPEAGRTAEGYDTPDNPETGSSLVHLSLEDGTVIGTDSIGRRYRFGVFGA